MREPTTIWDRAPSDSELRQFWGKTIERNAEDEIFEVLTKTVRKVPAKNLSLEYVRTVSDSGIYRAEIAYYPVQEVLNDYMGYESPMNALMAVIEKSDCPLVAELRKALASEFARHNAEEIDIHRSEQ